MYKRVCSFSLVVALSFCLFLVPVGAINANGKFTGYFGYNGVYPTFQIDLPRTGNKLIVGSVRGVNDALAKNIYCYEFRFSPASDQEFPSGAVGIYFSWAAASTIPGSFIEWKGHWDCHYSLADTSTYSTEVVAEYFNFYPADGLYPSNGQTVSVKIDDVDSLTSFYADFMWNSTVFTPDPAFYNPYDMHFYIPSASLVYTATSGELESLENIADSIAEGNAIAQAMYGDIMKALNAISADTEIVASYIEDMFSYIVHIDTATTGIYELCAAYLSNLASIAQSADNIDQELQSFHSDFMVKLELLIGTITQESDDIQATMDRIYEQLIAWLETNFVEAINPDFEQSNGNLSQGIQNNEAIEQLWTGSLSDSWNAMQIESFAFDASFTNGFLWVSTWFNHIYNALGLYGAIFLLPMLIGVCKLLLGYFRFSGDDRVRGNDSD